MASTRDPLAHIADIRSKNPEVQAEYDRLAPRYAVIRELIKARSARGMSQSEVARLIGVKPSAVSRIESGEHSPRLDSLFTLADAMGYEMKVTFKLKRGAGRKRVPAKGT